MVDRVLQVVDRQVRVSVAGGALTAALAAQAALPYAERAEAALAEIEDIAANAEDAPSVLNKLNKDGSNVGGDAADLREAIGADLAANVNFTPAGTGAMVRTAQDKARETVSVLDFGAVGDGTTDDSAAFQAACDALTNGGVVRVPRSASPYRVGVVTITNRNIAFDLESGVTLKKIGPVGGAQRGMFRVANLPRAHFVLRGAGRGSSLVDLNEEGPMEIGVAGRTPNTYGPLNGGVWGIAAPGNAAIYGLRSTHIYAHGISVENTSESCFLLRNCSDTLIADSAMRNAAHFGVEWSLTLAANDGGTAPMPDRSRHYVIGCHFEDMPDFAIGAGNGVAVGGGGSPEALAFKDYQVLDCTMLRCQRDVHVELNGGGYLDGVIVRISSRDAWQGSVGFVHAKNYDVKVDAVNPGAGPTSALSGIVLSYADIYGVVISGDKSDKGSVDVKVVDQRNSKTYSASDGAMTAGSAVFTSPTASFTTTSRVGDPFGVVGAGQSGVCLVTTVLSVDSNTQVTLALKAGTTVASADYAHGGATRNGVVLNEGGDINIRGRIEAGISSALPSEPPAAGVYVAAAVTGRVNTDGLSITAPVSLGSKPSGITLAGNLTGGKFRPGGVNIKGFNAAFVGTDAYRASCIGPSTVSGNGLAIEPSATINTYGTEEFVDPHGDRFSQLLGGGLTFTLGAETVTVQVTAYRFDGLANTVDIQSNTNGEQKSLSEFSLWQLNQDNAPLRRLGVKAKSSIGGSTASVVYFLRALEG